MHPVNNPVLPPPPVLLHRSSECITEEAIAAIPDCDETVDLSDCNGAMGRATAWGLTSTVISAAAGALLVAAFGATLV